MDGTLGWIVYVSISAAVAFYLAGYVTRSAILTRRTSRLGIDSKTAIQAKTEHVQNSHTERPIGELPKEKESVNEPILPPCQEEKKGGGENDQKTECGPECSVSKARSGNPKAPELAGEGVSGFPGCGTSDPLRFPFLGAPRPPRPSADSPTGVACPCERRKSERTLDTQHEGEPFDLLVRREPCGSQIMHDNSKLIEENNGEDEPQATWLPERDVLPPISCPVSQPHRSGWFPGESGTLPFHKTLPEDLSPPCNPFSTAHPTARDPDQKTATHSWIRWGTTKKGLVSRRRDIRRLRDSLRRLNRQQKGLEVRIDRAFRHQERLSTEHPLENGLSHDHSHPALVALIKDFPQDVSLAVVTGELGLPVQHTGSTKGSMEMAASLNSMKRMASEVKELAALRSPVRRIQVEDYQGVMLDCWLLDPINDTHSVILLRLPSTGPRDDVEMKMEEIAEALGLTCSQFYGLGACTG